MSRCVTCALKSAIGCRIYRSVSMPCSMIDGWRRPWAGRCCPGMVTTPPPAHCVVAPLRLHVVVTQAMTKRPRSARGRGTLYRLDVAEIIDGLCAARDLAARTPDRRLILMQNAIFSTTGPPHRQQPGEQVGNLCGWIGDWRRGSAEYSSHAERLSPRDRNSRAAWSKRFEGPISATRSMLTPSHVAAGCSAFWGIEPHQARDGRRVHRWDVCVRILSSPISKRDRMVLRGWWG